MPRAHERPSAIAQTISDWPRCMSPQVNTPGTLVIQFASRATLPRSVRATPSWLSMPGFSGPTKPIASRTRSASSANSLPATGLNSTRPPSRTIFTVMASSFFTRPPSPRNRCVDTE